MCGVRYSLYIFFSLKKKSVSHTYINKTKVSVGGENDFKKGQTAIYNSNSWVKIHNIQNMARLFESDKNEL